jgi:pimeloyl-ACP methyl ester carboxylesterase
LLILHGGPGSGSVSLRAALEEPLASSLRTIFFDQRSVGRSSAVSSFTLDDYLDDMERVRRALNVDSWYLFGVSWGAALANEYAVRHPNRVRGVITWGGLVANQPVTRSMVKQLRLFYAANADRRGTAWCRELEEQTSPYTRLQTVRVMNAVNRAGLKTVLPEESATAAVVAARDLAVRRWGYTASQTGTGLWATVATYMQERLETYDFRPRLPALTMPYLLLAGAHDPLLRDAGVADYARATPHATAKWILDSGHTLDRADVIASEIVGFVSAHSAE